MSTILVGFKMETDLETRLRRYTSHRGDVSRVLNEALKMWLDAKEHA